MHRKNFLLALPGMGLLARLWPGSRRNSGDFVAMRPETDFAAVPSNTMLHCSHDGAMMGTVSMEGYDGFDSSAGIEVDSVIEWVDGSKTFKGRVLEIRRWKEEGHNTPKRCGADILVYLHA